MRIILLGAPASGKGTLAEELEKKFSLKHLSSGQMIRAEIEQHTLWGRKMEKLLGRGDLLPDSMIVKYMLPKIKGRNKYVLDGFPRTVPQAEALSGIAIDVVVYIDVPERILVKRVTGRRTCHTGKHIYHVVTMPPKKEGICDVDGTSLEQREDDTPTLVKRRLKVYHKLTAPLIKYYRQQGLLQTVNGNQPSEKVYGDVQKLLIKNSKAFPQKSMCIACSHKL